MESRVSRPAAQPEQPDAARGMRRSRELNDLAQRTALVAGLGILCVLALPLFGRADLPMAAFAAAVIGLGAVLVYLNARPEIEFDASRAMPGQQALPPAGPPPELVLRRIISAMPDAAFVIDREGRIEAANARARSQFGVPASGARIASHLRDPVLLEAALDVATGGEPQSVPFASAGPLEEYFRAKISGLEIEGKRLALIVIHDETAAKKVERMRVDFLANASHELRTPLAAVVGSIETLTGHARGDPEAQERFLRLMQTQADRMRRLIDDLLSLSRIELNEHVPPSGIADFEMVTREVLDMVQPIAAQRKITLNFKRAEGASRVVGNREELGQIAQNLIDNAIKYAREGGVVEVEIGGDMPRETLGQAARRWPDAAHISLAAPPPDLGRSYAYLRVTDDGPGIPRESLPRLSERFYRVEEVKNSDRTGTGLGLAIVKHITNRHRGGFFVESRLGQGSAFTMAVPMAGSGLPPGSAA